MQVADSTLTPAKRCTKCGAVKPLPAFPTHRRKRDGRDSQCRSCKASQDAAYNRNNQEKRRDYRRRYYAENAEAAKKSVALWREENPAAVRAEKRRYRQRHREQLAQYSRDRYAADPVRARSYVHNSRGRSAGVGGSIAADDVRHHLHSQKGRCYWCGTPVADAFEIDHVVPLSRGGPNEPDNIVVSCTPCNRSKGNKLPEEWQGLRGR